MMTRNKKVKFLSITTTLDNSNILDRNALKELPHTNLEGLQYLRMMFKSAVNLTQQDLSVTLSPHNNIQEWFLIQPVLSFNSADF